jgi:hypothetical protein
LSKRGLEVTDKLLFERIIDDFSYQVSLRSDERFWFRLVREDNRDVITDFFLGALPKSNGGELLIGCYRLLGLVPKRRLVFTDITSGDPERDGEVYCQNEELYTCSGKLLLTSFGYTVNRVAIEEARGKFDLILFSEI